MKRHWPRVFSSFRSSKRRIQQLTLHESDGEVETARGCDEAMEAEEPCCSGVRPTIIQVNGSPPADTASDKEVPLETTEEAMPPNGGFMRRKLGGGSLSRQRSAQSPNSIIAMFGSKGARRMCASLREGKSSFLRNEEVHRGGGKNRCPPSIIPAPSSNDPPREDSASLGQASDVSAESEKSQIFHPHVDSTLAMKSSYILDELITTEKSYVKELEEVLKFYIEPFEAPENSTLVPPALRGQSELIFGNLRELVDFHSSYVLPELERNSHSLNHLCHIMIDSRSQFLSLYRTYCQRSQQSKPTMCESLRGEQTDQCAFFAECQKRAGHLLPLSAYLLKPIQRITKYQLLLRELLRSCPTQDNNHAIAQAALASMLDLLAQINADMQQLHILGYSGDLRQLGPLRLQMECDCFSFKRKTRRMSNKPQRRHLFLFDGGVLFCKRRTQPIPNAPEYYEHKLCIPVHNLGFVEASPNGRFELWDENRSDGFSIQAGDDKLRAKWLQKLARLVLPQTPTMTTSVVVGTMQKPIDAYSTGESTDNARQQSSFASLPHRPQSWTSEESFKSFSSSRSSNTSALEETVGYSCHIPDSNGNVKFVTTPSHSYQYTVTTPIIGGRNFSAN